MASIPIVIGLNLSLYHHQSKQDCHLSIFWIVLSIINQLIQPTADYFVIFERPND